MKRDSRGGVAGGVALAALLALLAGCFEPYPIHVDPTVATADLKWVRQDCPESSRAEVETCTSSKHEVDYRFRQGNGPPYPAILQVLSLREAGRRSTEELLALAHRAIDNGTAAESIERDASADQQGTRTLRSGVETHWFTREGTVEAAGDLFTSNVRVRIIGEVGYDGRSQTSFIAVGIAQVALRQCATPLPVQTCNTIPDNRSWISMVGDEGGSVGGAVKGTGLIYNLVTHD